MVTGILLSIALPLFDTDQDPFYQQNADRYIAVYCLTSSQYRSRPILPTEYADRYIAEYLLSYLFSKQIKTHFTNRMVTGILLSIALPLFDTDQDPFYQQNADRYIAVYCLTSSQYRSRPILPTEYADRYIAEYLLSYLFSKQIKTHFTNRMVTGILQSIVLPLFITDQDPFTNRMLTGILLYAVFISLLLQIKDQFLPFFTSFVITPTD